MKSRLESLPSHITDHTYSKKTVVSSSWIDTLTYGGLSKPSDELLKWVHVMEDEFLSVHGSEFNDRVDIMRKLIHTIQEKFPKIPTDIVKLFAKSRIYMRCKYLNKKRVEEALLKKKIWPRSVKRKGELQDDSLRKRSKKMKKIVT